MGRGDSVDLPLLDPWKLFQLPEEQISPSLAVNGVGPPRAKILGPPLLCCDAAGSFTALGGQQITSSSHYIDL